MTEETKYRLSQNEDLDEIRNLLQTSGLPVSDVIESKIDFIVATTAKNKLVGCIGVERYEKEGLLRSFAVDKAWRNKRIGHELLCRLFSLSRQYNITNLHLLTTTAEKFFLTAGFTVSSREDAPSVISSTSEFSTLCPSSSVYMTSKNIQQFESGCWRDVQVFQRDKETGSPYWSIKGENLMFTYFEVSPDTTFAAHEHASEQVTHVLEGELFFEIENKTYRLSAGDTIIIPANKKHKVWTTAKHTKAIDAWSPINEKYNNNKISF